MFDCIYVDNNIFQVFVKSIVLSVRHITVVKMKKAMLSEKYITVFSIQA